MKQMTEKEKKAYYYRSAMRGEAMIKFVLLLTGLLITAAFYLIIT